MKISFSKYRFHGNQWCFGITTDAETLGGKRVYCISINYGRGCAYMEARK